MCLNIPDGVVVFFPSYAYMETVIRQWQKSPPSGEKSIWERLASRKALLRETKGSVNVDVLQQFASAIENGHGGLLLSVVGGKMSEGINFSDRLGRGVIIVGLPFPNIQSAEWKARIAYIEASARSRANMTSGLAEEQKAEIAKAAGRDFYENACMRAVNQSIGRAIRHRGDYAAILLLDKRYDSARINTKLPGWIRNGLVKEPTSRNFGAAMTSLGTFFRSKKNKV
jgi:chromosome transmission fidelity protein 1